MEVLDNNNANLLSYQRQKYSYIQNIYSIS